jgi:serine phosphatase RsbU (regulator of sigma subunit)
MRALLLSLLLITARTASSGFEIKIDAQKDDFYQSLNTPDSGYIYLTPDDFLPISGPRPDNTKDLSGSVWLAWDPVWLYVYAEINDDIIRVNNNARPNNDCIEFKIDPDPAMKLLSGVVNARLTAVDTLMAENPTGVDNLYSEGDLDSVHISTADYARRISPEGYIVELRLKWEWIRSGEKQIGGEAGKFFGLGINIHDNDSDKRDGSINWSAGRADEIWINPLMLGTAVLEPGHIVKLIKRNSIDPDAGPGQTYLSMPLINKHAYKLIRPENWLYHAGDDQEWAIPGFDHSNWELINPLLVKDRMPVTGWNGKGWFRTNLIVDSSIVGYTLAFEMYQTGASEVYLDGNRIFRFGRVADPDSSELSYWERNPRYLTFRKSGIHLLAVRYSNTDYDRFHRYMINAGFQITFYRDLASLIDNRVNFVRELSLYQIIFFMIPLTLAVVHIFLFVFYPKAKEHLYFSVAMLCWAIIIFIDFNAPMVNNYSDILLLARISRIALQGAIVFGLLMLYQGLYKRIPGIGYAFILAGLVFAVWGQIDLTSKPMQIGVYLLIGVGAVEIFRLLFVYGIRGWKGRWITLVGFVCFMLAIIYQIASNIGWLPELGEYGITYVYGLLFLAITASIDLSRDFAMTNRDLEAKLAEVKTLSQKALEQERHAREVEVTRKLLEADNARKTQELEEARQLQLSMLPRRIPDLPQLEIAAFMKTATEVGGDYYDFKCNSNGTLTVAIGDATGHGMKAGTMVAAIKSLFAAFGQKLDIPLFFERCTEIIREMQLGNIYMAMMLARINGGSVTVSAAGMPPLFIYRAATGDVEEVVIKGMPLGAHLGLDYEVRKTDIYPGDTMLFMTDGYAELFNNKKEIMDYPRVKKEFRDHAAGAPKTVIDHLLRAGEIWQNGHKQQDDYTFIVIKYTPVQHNKP